MQRTWFLIVQVNGYPIPQLQVSFDACAHIPLTFMFCSWQRTHKNLWCSLQHLCCHCPKCWLSRGMKTITCVSFNHVQFLLLMNRHCVHQRWHLHLGWCYHCRPNVSGFTSLILCNSRIWCLQCGSSQKNELSWSAPHWSIRPFNNWSIWMFTQTSWCVLTWLCQCHFELEMAKGLSSFCFGYFFSSKNFNHIESILGQIADVSL